jgi:hypothetical protein
MKADTYKVVHWMNVRKVTAAQVADGVGCSLDPREAGAWPGELIGAVARFLAVEPEKLSASGRPSLTALCKTAGELHSTRREIQRGGIHFYNYYTMAAPPGMVGPVILDILCPAGRLPELNNGHLEPAITVNIGPGDIHGRWGQELSDDTWQVMHANHGDQAWVVGDSYVEPSYCPHSYSLATDRPARIISYTGHSNLMDLLEDLNDWDERAAAALLDLLTAGLCPRALAELLLARRGHTLATAARALGRPTAEVTSGLDQGSVSLLRDLGQAFGFDYRLLLPPEKRHDTVGKTYRTISESVAGARDFRGYQVASLASAPYLPDLTGLFVRVDGDRGGELRDAGETHYLVTSGELELEYASAAGQEHARLGADGTAWIAPWVAHRWTGHGSLVKLGSGRHPNYLDLIELTNTYAPAATVGRGHHDSSGWGYDS